MLVPGDYEIALQHPKGLKGKALKVAHANTITLLADGERHRVRLLVGNLRPRQGRLREGDRRGQRREAHEHEEHAAEDHAERFYAEGELDALENLECPGSN